MTEPFAGAGLVWVNGISENVGFSLQNYSSLPDSFELIAINVENFVFKNKHRIVYEPDSLYPKSYFIDNESYTINNQINADANFDDIAYRLASEIRERIQLLKESGSLKLINDIFEEIQGASKKLSTLFITNDYRIFLKDYGMKEVAMPPLPKSVL